MDFMQHEFVFNNRWRDYETGKFDLDKIDPINSYALGDIIDDVEHRKNVTVYEKYERVRSRPSNYTNPTICKLYDDIKFPELANKRLELERKLQEKEKRMASVQAAKRLAARAFYQRSLDAREQHRLREQERRRVMQIQDEALAAYYKRQQSVVSKVEDERIYLGGPYSGQRVSRNTWIVK